MPSAIRLEDIPIYIAAIGALGVASFGIVDAVGKALFVFDMPVPWAPIENGRRRRASLGLPYVGFDKVRRLAHQVAPALRISYGEEYDRILRQQYRAGRGQGEAPDTIRQGVRLGLPFLSPAQATKVIDAVWGLPEAQAEALADALTAEKRATAAAAEAVTAEAPTPEAVSKAQADAQALAARFATALDTRVQAAFDLAEEVYQARARLWAAVIAIVLSLAYHATTAGDLRASFVAGLQGWMIALLIGLAAVPLAPMAKDLASSLSDALGALGKLRAKPQG
jgi:hypothetical protein